MRVSRSAETVVSHLPDQEPGLPPRDERLESAAPAYEPLQTHRSSPVFSELLRGLGRELDRGERLAEGAIRGSGAGGDMSPHQLIALQAGIYRYTEALDLVTKLVDRAGQAVRTTLQNQ